MSGLRAFAQGFVALFVALDIIGVLPLYVGMTREMSRDESDRITDLSMVVALGVAFVFLIAGGIIFRSLAITLFDFKIAGGIVLLLISLADLVSRPEAVTRSSGSTGIVPLAVPLITGPGVLTTLILQVNTVGYWITIMALLVNYFLAWALLRRSYLVTRLIGKDGAVVVSKIAALLLAAIAIAMIRSGVFDAAIAFRKL